MRTVRPPEPAASPGGRASLPRLLLAQPLFRFGAVGGVVTLFFMGLNALLSRSLGLSQEVSFLAAYPPALVLHFTLNKLWTFRDVRTVSGRHVAEYLYSVVVTFLIQWPAFLLLHEGLRLRGWLAAGGANVLQMGASFALLRWRVFSKAGPEPEEAASVSWHRLAALMCVLATSALLAWTALGTWALPPLQRTENDYYNLLVSGFRHGHLYLDVAVPEELKNAADPYDPNKRPHGSYLHDASYYQGHYYLYFGVVPAVLLFWPFKAATGYALPFVFGTIISLVGANWITAWLWLRVLRDRFPRASLVTKLTGIVGLGLCGGQLVLARRASLWEMPIGAGYFFTALLISASYLALTRPRARGWLALAGLSLGLAVGCRPTLVAAGAGLAVLVLVVGWRNPGGAWLRFRCTVVAALAAGLPLATIIGGLLAYNYARFHNPFEFGIRYQLNTNNELMAQHFRPLFLPFNFHAYFLSAPRMGRYFPFIHQPDLGQLPKGYYGTEFVYGAVWVCPVIFWLVFAWIPLRRRELQDVGGFAAVVAAVALAVTAILLGFDTAAARYVADFLPDWLWLAFLGWASLEHTAAGGWGIGLRALLGLTWLVTVAATVVLSLSLHSVLVFKDRATYFRIARWFDYPTALYEKLSGQRMGELMMDVRFPSAPGGSLEPLVVTGVGYESDYFFAFYGSDRTVRLGFENTGDSMLISQPIPYDPTRFYHLGFLSGSLLPPEGHPIYSGWDDGELLSHLSWVRIDFDGKPVVNQARESNQGAPEFLQIGQDVRYAAFGKRFSGTIANVHREPLQRPVRTPESHGDIILDLTLPTEVIDAPQPLVVVGRTGRAELVGYRTLDDKHFSLSYEYWGAGLWQSPPIEVPDDRDVQFRIRLGSVLQADANNPYFNRYNHDVVVWMNGKAVWWRKSAGELDPNPKVQVLANLIGSSAMRRSFAGVLRSVSRAPVPPWKHGPFGALEVYVMGRGTAVQPLVATGSTGRADTLAIEWLPNRKARLLYDHWGFPLFIGPPFDWSDEIHQLLIQLPAFATLDRSPPGDGSGPLHVVLDGRTVAEGRVGYFDAPSSSLIFGGNPAGSSVTGAKLDLALADIQQLKQLRLPAK